MTTKENIIFLDTQAIT